MFSVKNPKIESHKFNLMHLAIYQFEFSSSNTIYIATLQTEMMFNHQNHKSQLTALITWQIKAINRL